MTQKTQHIADYLHKFMPRIHHRKLVSNGVRLMKLQQILKQMDSLLFKRQLDQWSNVHLGYLVGLNEAVSLYCSELLSFCTAGIMPNLANLKNTPTHCAFTATWPFAVEQCTLSLTRWLHPLTHSIRSEREQESKLIHNLGLCSIFI